ncbi:hypothetical protein GCM10007920_31710 [Ciceribacter naphthalenivorans]|uniref:Uncharacterized protein n=2 Tax=Alphaproteobacteria TaxID=28211 RepID=A0A512HN26_9HYPH|nr:hypothetical protein RNA01_37320 [Ciceribacter naphthalenivorans]GLR23380.1 hypothetical protein GCM10007920_31710 [Ciceribacter naphthalenivorans]GLT06236.1 hypothetical protein GCM10007926_31710 [Sphingomonas psychrolutea]
MLSSLAIDDFNAPPDEPLEATVLVDVFADAEEIAVTIFEFLSKKSF